VHDYWKEHSILISQSAAGSRSSSVLCGVFIAEGDGIADKRSGDTTTVDVLTEGLSEHVPEIYLFH